VGDFWKNVGENFRNLRRFISGKGEVERWRRVGEKEKSNVRGEGWKIETEDKTAITFLEKRAM